MGLFLMVNEINGGGKGRDFELSFRRISRLGASTQAFE